MNTWNVDLNRADHRYQLPSPPTATRASIQSQGPMLKFDSLPWKEIYPFLANTWTLGASPIYLNAVPAGSPLLPIGQHPPLCRFSYASKNHSTSSFHFFIYHLLHSFTNELPNSEFIRKGDRFILPSYKPILGFTFTVFTMSFFFMFQNFTSCIVRWLM